MKKAAVSALLLFLGSISAPAAQEALSPSARARTLRIAMDAGGALSFGGADIAPADLGQYLHARLAEEPESRFDLALDPGLSAAELELLILTMREGAPVAESTQLKIRFLAPAGEGAVPFLLPADEQAPLSLDDDMILALGIGADGSYALDGAPCSAPDLGARIAARLGERPAAVILLNPADQAPYQAIYGALAAARQAGAERISLWGANAGALPAEVESVAGAAEIPEGMDFDTPPLPTQQTQPQYPQAARDAGMAGRVLVRLFVDETGQVYDSMILESDAPGLLQDEALAAARQWRFEPGMKDGKPVKTCTSIPFEFRLRE